MNLLGKVVCEWCGAYHPLNIYYEYVPLDIHGIRFEALEVYARCYGCGQKIYVPEINDVNAVIRETEYIKAKERKERRERKEDER